MRFVNFGKLDLGAGNLSASSPTQAQARGETIIKRHETLFPPDRSLSARLRGERAGVRWAAPPRPRHQQDQFPLSRRGEGCGTFACCSALVGSVRAPPGDCRSRCAGSRSGSRGSCGARGAASGRHPVSCCSACCPPSSSIASLRAGQAKSTIYGPIGCCAAETVLVRHLAHAPPKPFFRHRSRRASASLRPAFLILPASLDAILRPTSPLYL